MKFLLAIGCLLALANSIAFAEAPRPNEVVDQSQALGTDGRGVAGEAAGQDFTEARAQLLKKLSAKLLNYKGQPVSMVVFNPIDFTSSQVGTVVADTLVKSLKKYGDLNVRLENYVLENLTLGEFRKGMAEFKVDVLVATSLRNTNFDIYIYDRRTPYFIYAHSEPIPELTQLQINEEVAGYYTKLALRRALFRYINDQYYELPRQESAPVLQSEIPRWIASPESLAQINRELVSSMYLAVNTGALFTFGKPSAKNWNSPLLGIQLGYRINGNLFGELAYENSSYHVVTGAFRYVFLNRDSPFRVGVSLGATYLSNKRIFDPDLTLGLGTSTLLAMGGVSVLFPVGDVYFKLEERNFFAVSGAHGFMFSLMPGLLIHF